jgi:hypothetical protein
MVFTHRGAYLFLVLEPQSQMTRQYKPAISDIHVSAWWNLLTLQRSKEYWF